MDKSLIEKLTRFFQETVARLSQTSPKFFKIWNRINSGLLVVSGIPTILNWLDIPDLETFLPPTWAKYVLKIIAFAAGWGLLMNKLPVQGTAVGVTEGGNVLKVTPDDKLPFTAAVEKKLAEKENAPVVEVKVIQ